MFRKNLNLKAHDQLITLRHHWKNKVQNNSGGGI